MSKEIKPKVKAMDFRGYQKRFLALRERKIKSLKSIEKTMKKEGIGLEELITWMLKGDLI